MRKAKSLRRALDDFREISERLAMMKMEDKEDRMSYALDKALQYKPNARKTLTNNEMLHQIFTRFDKDVDFRLNDEEFIDFLKALDPNWKEHIVDIAWEVRSSSMYSSMYINSIASSCIVRLTCGSPNSVSGAGLHDRVST